VDLREQLLERDIECADRATAGPMTLLRKKYADEIFDAITAHGLSITHILLHATTQCLLGRITGHNMFPEDPQHNQRVQAWRLDHLPDYADALPWLRTSAHVIDTTHLNPVQAADAVLRLLAT